MERLTERYIPNNEKKGIAGIKVFESEDKIPLVKVLSGEYLYTAIEKLATYEDLEEQGLLVRLPCKVGDSVFIIVGKDISRQGIRKIEISDNSIIFKTNRQKRIFNVAEFGKTVFLTREEAVNKLEVMKKNG